MEMINLSLSNQLEVVAEGEKTQVKIEPIDSRQGTAEDDDFMQDSD